MSTNDIIKNNLKKLDLEEREILIYLACLNGYKNATDISRFTDVKRATVYLYLDKLRYKGLVEVAIENKKRTFVVASPKTAFRNLLANRKNELKLQEKVLGNILPEILKTPSDANMRPKIFSLFGDTGIKFLIEKIIASKKDIRWIGPTEVLVNLMPEEEIYNLFTKRRIRQKTSSYAITDRSILKFPKLSRPIGNTRFFRLLNTGFEIPAILGTFGSSIFLISKEIITPRVIIIENQEMTDIVSFLFQSLWNKLTYE